ncbi:hypothetical protein BDV18DRAFT_10215 [Aspergillus unguis]
MQIKIPLTTPYISIASQILSSCIYIKLWYRDDHLPIRWFIAKCGSRFRLFLPSTQAFVHARERVKFGKKQTGG